MAEVVIGGLLADSGSSILVNVAGRLSRSIFYRWRVVRLVKRRVPFDFPAISAFAWFKTITVAELAPPREVGAAPLAISLDLTLSYNTAWREDPDRLSKAVQIVEAAYEVILSMQSPGDSRVLREHWASARHDEILAALRALPGVDLAMLDHGDRAALLMIDSAARTAARLRSFGIELDDDLASFLSDTASATELRGERTHVLIGSFGSGKSEIAEQWFRARAVRYGDDRLAPPPLWLYSSELTGQSLESRIFQSIPSVSLRASGAAVVIDGLDEVDTATAARVVDAAHVLTSTNAHCEVLVTCRPGVLRSSDDQTIISGLSDDAASRLIGLVLGDDRRGGPSDLGGLVRDSIRRPFFALAIAVMLRDGVHPRGDAHLIRHVVENALTVPNTAQVLRATDLRDTLTTLAVNLTESGSGRDGLTFAERQVALSSTVVEERSGLLEFSLPIFQQWFAAQYLLANLPAVDEIASEAAPFDRWRWALAVAGVAADEDQLDELLERALRGNPGAGSWLLSRIAEGHRWYRAPTDSRLDYSTASARLLRTARCWTSALGPLATRLLPIEAIDDPITIGVRVDGVRVGIGWSAASSDQDQVLLLPEEVNAFAQRVGAWTWIRDGTVPEGIEWPWMVMRDIAVGPIASLLAADPVFGPEGGIWQAESEYQVARLLVRQPSHRFSPIPTKDVLDAAAPLLDLVEREALDVDHTTLKLGRHTVELHVVSTLVQRLRATGDASVTRPSPSPDALHGGEFTSWPLEQYTSEGLLRFHAEVLSQACQAYEEAAASVMGNFAWSLSTASSSPLGAVAEVTYSEERFGDFRSFVLTYALVPRSAVQALRANGDDHVTISEDGRVIVRLGTPTNRFGSSWVDGLVDHARPSSTAVAFQQLVTHRTIEDFTRHARPASELAASWIWSDLSSLGLTTGTGPRFER